MLIHHKRHRRGSISEKYPLGMPAPAAWVTAFLVAVLVCTRVVPGKCFEKVRLGAQTMHMASRLQAQPWHHWPGPARRKYGGKRWGGFVLDKLGVGTQPSSIGTSSPVEALNFDSQPVSRQQFEELLETIDNGLRALPATGSVRFYLTRLSGLEHVETLCLMSLAGRLAIAAAPCCASLSWAVLRHAYVVGLMACTQCGGTHEPDWHWDQSTHSRTVLLQAPSQQVFWNTV